MSTHSGALPGILNADLYDHPTVVEAQIRALDDRIRQFGDLEAKEETLIREFTKAKQEHQGVVARVQPEIDILSQIQPPLTEARQRQLDGLQGEVARSQAHIAALEANLASVRADKEVLKHLYESREQRKQRLEQSLAKVRANEPVLPAAAAATAQETPQAETPPVAPAIDYTAELRRLGYNEREIAILQDRNVHANVVAGQVRRDRYYTETAWFQTAVDAQAPARPETRDNGSRNHVAVWIEDHRGLSALLAFLLAIILLIMALAIWNAWPKAQTRAETTPAPTALATASARAATFLDEPISQGIGPDRNRVYAFTSVPTTARLIDIERDVVVAEDKTSSQLHKLDWTVPTFADLEKTFKLKVEISTSGAYGSGQPVTVKPIDVRVLKNSVSAGGTTQIAQLPDALRVPTNQVGRDALVSVLRSAALDRPGVSGVNSGNIADFVQANLSRFKRVPLDRTLTGQFAFVGADGIVRYAPVTIPAGEPVITFDDILLASALCNNVTAPPSGPTPSPRVVVTPTPTPTTTATPAPTSPPCCTFVPTPAPTPTPTKNPSNAPLGGGSPTPMPPSQAPAPTYTPPPAVGSNIQITYSQSCGTGCQEIRWTASGSVSASILYGLTGNSMTNFKSASSSGSYWYVQIKNLSPGQSYTFTVSVWYANNVQERTNGSFIAP